MRKTSTPETSSQSLLTSRPAPPREIKPIMNEMQDTGSVLKQEKITQLRDYHCLYCDFFTKKKKVLDIHMESSHPDKPATPTEFECTTCGKVFPKRTNLIKHLLIHGYVV